MSLRVLIAEDEDGLRQIIARVLRREGYEVVEAASGEDALDKFRETPCPLVITDIVMGRMNGFELIEEILRLEPDTVTVLMTSHAGLDATTGAMRANAMDLLIKPFEDIRLITSVVHRAADRIRLMCQNRDLVDRLRQQDEQVEKATVNLSSGAARDVTTGLYNERFFLEALDLELARSRRYERMFSVAILEPRGIKRTGDADGALCDEARFKRVARLLSDRCRNSDLISAWRGSRLALLLPETDRPGAVACLVGLRSHLEAQPDQLGPGGGVVRLGAGFVVFPVDGSETAQLLDRAEEALHRSVTEQSRRIVAWRESVVLND